MQIVLKKKKKKKKKKETKTCGVLLDSACGCCKNKWWEMIQGVSNKNISS